MRYSKGEDTTTQTAYCPVCRKKTVEYGNEMPTDNRMFWSEHFQDVIAGCVPTRELCCSEECLKLYQQAVITESVKDYPRYEDLNQLADTGTLGGLTEKRHAVEGATPLKPPPKWVQKLRELEHERD